MASRKSWPPICPRWCSISPNGAWPIPARWRFSIRRRAAALSEARTLLARPRRHRRRRPHHRRGQGAAPAAAAAAARAHGARCRPRRRRPDCGRNRCRAHRARPRRQRRRPAPPPRRAAPRPLAAAARRPAAWRGDGRRARRRLPAVPGARDDRGDDGVDRRDARAGLSRAAREEPRRRDGRVPARQWPRRQYRSGLATGARAVPGGGRDHRQRRTGPHHCLAAAIGLGDIEARFADRIEAREDVSVRSRDARAARAAGRAASAPSRSAEQPMPVVPDEATAKRLAAAIAARGPRSPALDQGAAAMARPRRVPARRARATNGPIFPTPRSPDSAAEWLAPLLADKTALSATLRGGTRMPRSTTLLPYEMRGRLEAEAPTHFDAPSGSRVPIEYEADGAQARDPRAGTVRPRPPSDHRPRPRAAGDRTAVAGPPAGAGHPRPAGLLARQLCRRARRPARPLSAPSLARGSAVRPRRPAAPSRAAVIHCSRRFSQAALIRLAAFEERSHPPSRGSAVQAQAFVHHAAKAAWRTAASDARYRCRGIASLRFVARPCVGSRLRRHHDRAGRVAPMLTAQTGGAARPPMRPRQTPDPAPAYPPHGIVAARRRRPFRDRRRDRRPAHAASWSTPAPRSIALRERRRRGSASIRRSSDYTMQGHPPRTATSWRRRSSSTASRSAASSCATSPALVLPDEALAQNLLGMSFLSRLHSASK